MSVEKRRIKIIKILQENKDPLPAKSLAETFDVSRQVIVKDISVLKAEGREIISTNRGYLLKKDDRKARTIKVNHGKKDIEDELNILVDNKVFIKDVFVVHKAYGKIKRDLNIKSRNGVKTFLKSLENDSPLLKLTSGSHYHTILGEEEDIKKALENLGKRGNIEK